MPGHKGKKLATKTEQKSKQLEFLEQAQKAMLDVGYNPIEAMIMMAQDECLELDPMDRFKMHQELAGYAAPKLRAVNVDSPDDGKSGPTSITIKEFVVNVDGEGRRLNSGVEIDGEIVNDDDV